MLPDKLLNLTRIIIVCEGPQTLQKIGQLTLKIYNETTFSFYNGHCTFMLGQFEVMKMLRTSHINYKL